MPRYLFLACSLFLMTVDELRAEPPKHLVLIAIDTLRADHLSCYGYERTTTPNLDRLAKEGTRFEHAFATAPWTLPSFASVFSGRYPTRHGAGTTGAMRHLANALPTPITPEATTLGELFRAAGFRTAAVTSNPYLLLGMQRGFERFECRSMSADRVGALALAWLATQSGQEPFFLFVHFNDPHEPTDVADPFLKQLGFDDAVLRDPERRALERWGQEESYLGRIEEPANADELLRTKLALYDAAILQVDMEIGRLLETLRRRELLEDTLIVVVSDHGEEFLDHAEVERDRAEDPRGIWGIGHGHTLYAEQLRVPLIVRGPGVPRDHVVGQSMSLVDLMPTIGGWMGVDVPEGMDGEDRRAWIADADRSELPALAESVAYGPDVWAWIRWPYKIIVERGVGPRELFRLDDDPLEQENLLPQAESDLLLAEAEEFLRWLSEHAPEATSPGELDPRALEGLRALGYVE